MKKELNRRSTMKKELNRKVLSIDAFNFLSTALNPLKFTGKLYANEVLKELKEIRKENPSRTINLAICEVAKQTGSLE